MKLGFHGLLIGKRFLAVAMNVFAARYVYFWRSLKMISGVAKNSKRTTFLPVSLALYPCSNSTLPLLGRHFSEFTHHLPVDNLETTVELLTGAAPTVVAPQPISRCPSDTFLQQLIVDIRQLKLL